MADYRMPALGADMETGKVVRWLVSPGSRVHPGDVVAVVETHKGAIDCEIFLDGVIEDLVPEGTELPVGSVLAHVRGPSMEGGEQGVTPAPAPAPGIHASAPAAGGNRTLRASPAARRRAGELGVDLAQVGASAPGAPLALADVERAARAGRGADAVAQGAPPRTGFDPAAMRKGIAIAMARSKREIPHYYLARDVDFAAAEHWLAGYNASRAPEERLLPAVLLLKAAAVALARHPQFNGFWDHDAHRPVAAVHAGWAVAMRGGGLVAPAIHDADRKPLAQLMRDMRELVQRVRQGGLRSSEMTDPTVTITSLGDRGAHRVFGVIYPPQVALIGFGAVRPCATVVDGKLAVRPQLEASLAADHRASDGHAGSLLLAEIDQALQLPEQL